MHLRPAAPADAARGRALVAQHESRVGDTNRPTASIRSGTSRTQEFVLRWRSEADQVFSEIVRQQWNFSPPQTGREIEDYRVDLASVKVLELVIVPDIGGGSTLASLENLRLA